MGHQPIPRPMVNGTLDAALALAADGYPVFPVVAGEKRPACAHGVKDASDEPATIRAWFRGGRSNLAVRCGGTARLVIVDLDPRHGGTVAALEARLGITIPPTRTVSTPSGGYHLWYRWPDGVDLPRNSAGGLAAGIDIRSTGGYVLVPPSVGGVGGYTWLDEREPAEAPAALVEAAGAPPAPPTPLPADYEPPAILPGSTGTPWGCAVLQSALDTIRSAGEGTRHGVLLAQARLVGGVLASGHLAGRGARVAELVEASIASGHERRDAVTTARDGVAYGHAAPIRPDARIGAVRAPLATRPALYEGTPGALPANILPLAEAEALVHRTVREHLAGTIPVPAAPTAQHLDGSHDPAEGVRVVIVAAGTGVGKTHITADEIVHSASRVAWAAPSHALVAVAVKELRLAGADDGDYAVQAPRSADPTARGYCPRTEEEPDLLATCSGRNRWVASLACAKCPWGSEAMAQLAELAGDTAKAAAIRRIAVDDFGPADAACPACPWQMQMAAVRSARIALCTHAAYAPSLMAGRDLLVIDEAPATTSPITVTGEAMGEWAEADGLAPENLRREADRLERRAAAARRRHDDVAAGQYEADAAEARTAAVRVEAEFRPALDDLWQGTRDAMPLTGSVPAPDAVRDAIRRLAAITTWRQDRAAAWERWHGGWGVEAEMPLRALADLAWAAEHEGALEVANGGLHATVPTTLGGEVLGGTSRCLVLTATPPPELVAAAEVVIEAPVDQGQSVELFPAMAMGATGTHVPERAGRYARTVRQFRAAMEREIGDAPWVLTLMRAEAEAEADLHWGAHEGRNDFGGRAGLIAGMWRLPPAAEAGTYSAARVVALAAGADPADWPEWDGERATAGELVEVGPGLWVRSTIRLPANPVLRQWFLAFYAARVAQAAGRARGARHVAAGGSPLPLWLVMPPLPLAQFGLRVVAVRETPEGVRSRWAGGGWNPHQHLDADHRARIGVALCRREGIAMPLERAVRRACHRLGLQGPGGKTWPKLVAAGLLDLGTDDEIEVELDDLLAEAEARAGAGASAEEMRSSLAELVGSALAEDGEGGNQGSARTAAVWILASVLGILPDEAGWAAELPALAGAPPG